MTGFGPISVITIWNTTPLEGGDVVMEVSFLKGLR